MVAQQESEAASVESMDWHPSTRVRILMTASRDRTVRLFEVRGRLSLCATKRRLTRFACLQIDGNSNPLLQSLHVPSLPLTYAAFHPSGSSVLLAGPRPYLYAYDLQSGRALRSTPWRGTSNDANTAERDLSMARFQPIGAESGRLLAIGGRRGAVHLLDWGSGQGGAGAGAGAALVGSLRVNAPLVGLQWDQTASAAGRRLLSLSKQGSVHVWDTRAMRCAVERRDPGLFGAQGLAQSPSGAHWAVGSESGTVNVYDGSTASEEQTEKAWAPVKELGNLVTRTTTLSWNHDGQMLAVASRNKKDALKLVSLGVPLLVCAAADGRPLAGACSLAQRLCQLADRRHAARPRHRRALLGRERVCGSGKQPRPRAALLAAALRAMNALHDQTLRDGMDEALLQIQRGAEDDGALALEHF